MREKTITLNQKGITEANAKQQRINLQIKWHLFATVCDESFLHHGP